MTRVLLFGNTSSAIRLPPSYTLLIGNGPNTDASFITRMPRDFHVVHINMPAMSVNSGFYNRQPTGGSYCGGPYVADSLPALVEQHEGVDPELSFPSHTHVYRSEVINRDIGSLADSLVQTDRALRVTETSLLFASLSIRKPAEERSRDELRSYGDGLPGIVPAVDVKMNNSTCKLAWHP